MCLELLRRDPLGAGQDEGSECRDMEGVDERIHETVCSHKYLEIDKTLSIVIICFPNLGKYGESWAFHRAQVPLDDQREVAGEKSTNHEQGGLGSLHILWGKSVL